MNPAGCFIIALLALGNLIVVAGLFVACFNTL